ncbi:hypothetical protein A4X06_0g9712 [Tilletia controversa]|uniref:Uncharacterized protein n=1 Tax=Tilletia controversa TaxID=13291 RepID=A0A8X7MIK4_9BASI|nr:hypothetical protein CF328_g9198 [Tilletia controversa]KAE8235934.1 hypothetical protein A4X06_0g9712 [Tilletia controversa]
MEECFCVNILVVNIVRVKQVLNLAKERPKGFSVAAETTRRTRRASSRKGDDILTSLARHTVVTTSGNDPSCQAATQASGNADEEFSELSDEETETEPKERGQGDSGRGSRGRE